MRPTHSRGNKQARPVRPSVCLSHSSKTVILELWFLQNTNSKPHAGGRHTGQRGHAATGSVICWIVCLSQRYCWSYYLPLADLRGPRGPCPPTAKSLQLLGDKVPQTPYRGSAPGPRWGTTVPQTPWIGPLQVHFLDPPLLSPPCSIFRLAYILSRISQKIAYSNHDIFCACYPWLSPVVSYRIIWLNEYELQDGHWPTTIKFYISRLLKIKGTGHGFYQLLYLQAKKAARVLASL